MWYVHLPCFMSISQSWPSQPGAQLHEGREFGLHVCICMHVIVQPALMPITITFHL